MRFASLTSGILAFCAVFAFARADAAVTKDQFPPHTTGDLIALCSATKDDPLMTAAVNFCQGFAEGAVELALGYDSTTRSGRHPFCLPDPKPSHDEALAQFKAWANADPARLSEPPAIGLVRFLVHQYPCARPSAHRSSGR